MKSQIKVKKLFRFILYQNVTRYWFSHVRSALIVRLKSADRGFRYHAGDDPSNVDLTLLKSFAEQEHALKPVSQSFFCHKPGQTKSLLSLSNAVIDPLTSYVYDSERRFMGDFSSLSVDYAMWRFTMRPPKKVANFRPGTHLFLGSNTYYHWLIEELPTYLMALKQFPSATTLVHGMAPKYVFDALDLQNVIYEVIHKCTQVEELVFVSKSATLQPDSTDTVALRDACASWFSNSKQIGVQSRFYISRLNQGRFPDNELDIQNLFSSYGFKILDLVDFDLKEQIKLFSSAQVIAGTHGAGLSNIVWAPPKSSVIEILKWQHPKCYETLAEIGSQRYFGVQNNGENWCVDLSLLESVIKSSLV